MPTFPKDPPVELLNALRANTGYPTLSEKEKADG